ncbi:response regulator transcription factor [Anaerocolumna sp. MB42-C2]|uniref:response regulator transcription factor n=1 Tax=Anaerocolumna sp. MB42-C2 TaxID=3070997 RepID=UPI0027DFEB23|nr:response regulator [Anaerocolumna sp. MB42-C2]WMJ89774.1 response regulator [Anaerocolumna sp. MB42-C2]
MRIIIVDDESITRQWVKTKIEKIDLNYHVVGEFANGKQALEYCAKNKVDVIFTDIRMATMDGLEFLSEVRKLNLNAYKIILSAYDEFYYARQAMKLGAHEFVLKPEITKESISEILREAKIYLENVSREENISEEQYTPETYLVQLLERSGYQKEEDLRQEFKEKGILLDSSELVVSVVSFPKGLDNENVLEIIRLFFKDKAVKSYCFLWEKQDFVILYNSSIKTEREESAWELAEVLYKNIGTESYMGFSNIGKDFHNIPDLFRQASDARDNRIFYGMYGVQLYDRMVVRMEKDSQDLYYNREIKEITDCFEKGKFNEVKEGTVKLFTLIQQNNALYPAYIKAICVEILSAYIQKIRKHSLNSEYEEGMRTIEKLIGNDNERYTLEDLKKYTLEAQDYFSNILENKRKMRCFSVPVQDIINYVENNFSKRISMEEIADQVHLNKTYISVLFKKETDENFSDFLQRIRLENSCRLLTKTRLPIQEIAEQSGFFDAAYFSRVFKEKYALTPVEYRRLKIK